MGVKGSLIFDFYTIWCYSQHKERAFYMDYLSVTQYAKETGKDVGNIRRMLISGRLEGKKVGNHWIIPADAVYPADLRVKSGHYRNWRNNQSMFRKNTKLVRTLQEMSIKISDVYENRLEKVVVYGSYARGEETEESDIDIALILNEEETETMHDDMTDIVVDYELEQGKMLSVIVIDNKNYSVWKDVLPFYKNIDNEGVVIWKAR